jgi:hypothetical protein
MVRERRMNLNGLWDCAVTASAGDEVPAKPEGLILVPFPIESALSGVGRSLDPGERLWFRRTYRVPDEWKRERVLLHFGALALEAKGYTAGYVYEPLSEAARGSLRADANTLAVHCRQIAGGQYIDVGLVEFVR